MRRRAWSRAFARPGALESVTRTRPAACADGLWTVLIEYLVDNTAHEGKRSRVDYKDVLSESDFAVFTNEHLAGIATAQPKSISALMTIPGIGQSRADQFGQAVLGVVEEAGAAGRETALPRHPPHLLVKTQDIHTGDPVQRHQIGVHKVYR